MKIRLHTARLGITLATLTTLACGAKSTPTPPAEPPSPGAPVTPPPAPTPPGATAPTPPGTPTPPAQPTPPPGQPTPPPAPPTPTPNPTPPTEPPTTPPPAPPAGKPMHIYWIDVEGGAATLLVAPNGQTLLHDAGWSEPRGGASRIMPVLTEAGAKQLDYFLASHYHVDHLSGIASLARAVTVANFIDHGMNVEGADYGYGAAAARGKRTSMKAGQKFQLGEVEITIVAAAGQVTEPLPAAKANVLCEGAQVKSDDPDEDPQSLGFMAKFGAFEFVALGDLTWGVEHRIACPMNRLGEIELFQASQHGSAESNPPQLVHGLAPLAIVVNNGSNKGGASSALQIFKRSPGLQGLWQVHRSGSAGTTNTEDANIANVGDTNNWLRATIQPDGSFTIFNPRNQMSGSYQSR